MSNRIEEFKNIIDHKQPIILKKNCEYILECARFRREHLKASTKPRLFKRRLTHKNTLVRAHSIYRGRYEDQDEMHIRISWVRGKGTGNIYSSRFTDVIKLPAICIPGKTVGIL